MRVQRCHAASDPFRYLLDGARHLGRGAATLLKPPSFDAVDPEAGRKPVEDSRQFHRLGEAKMMVEPRQRLLETGWARASQTVISPRAFPLTTASTTITASAPAQLSINDSASPLCSWVPGPSSRSRRARRSADPTGQRNDRQ